MDKVKSHQIGEWFLVMNDYRILILKMISRNYNNVFLPMTAIIKKTVTEIIKQLMAAFRLSGVENSFLMLLSIAFIGNFFEAKLGRHRVLT